MFSLQDLYEMFREAPDIDLKNWDVGEAKTLTHLLDEILEGEAKVELVDGEIHRNIEVVSITIFSPTNPTMLLRETGQVFTDGRKRVRNLPNNCSIAEKIKFLNNETPEVAVIRACQEELRQIQEPVNAGQLQYISTHTRQALSTSYPGVLTNKTVYIFHCNFTQGQYNPEGYTEIQDDKTNYFKWFQIPTTV
jgi:hypothetical protein